MNTDTIIVEKNHCPQSSVLLSKSCISEEPWHSASSIIRQPTHTSTSTAVSMDVKPIHLISTTYSEQTDDFSATISEVDKQNTNIVNTNTNITMTSKSSLPYPKFRKLKTGRCLDDSINNSYINPSPTTYSEQIENFSANISENNDPTTSTAVSSDTTMSKSTKMSETKKLLKFRKLKTVHVSHETSNTPSINSPINSCSEQSENISATISENYKQTTNMPLTPETIRSESPVKFSIPKKPGIAANTRSRKLKITRTLSDSGTLPSVTKTDREKTDSTNGTTFFTNYYQSFLNIRKQVN